MSMRTLPERLTFNGIDGVHGGPAFQEPTVDELLAFARGRRPDRGALEIALRRLRDAQERFLDIEDGVDPRRIEEAGWGVVFPKEGDPAIREALDPLLRWREQQAKARDERLFQIYAGSRRGHGQRETVSRFLEHRGASDGPVKPRQMPYYLLLVGGPDQISFEFQYQLDVRYAVGRVCFDTPAEYAAYADNVVALEKRFAQGELPVRRRAALFAPSQPGEGVEQRLVTDLVRPLVAELARTPPRGWEVETFVNQQATRSQLLDLLGSEVAPDLVFTATHGLIYDDHPRVRDDQGALLCYGHHGQDPRPFAVGAADLAGRAAANGGAGQITMHFGCFTAGIPVWDGFELRPDGTPRAYATAPFTTALPRRLLGRPGGGTLAVVGHVDRAWTYSFASQNEAPRLAVFEQCLRRLIAGDPVGHALEPFNLRNAALSAEWLSLLQREQLEPWSRPSAAEMTDTFCTWLDARSFVVLGDAAVRLPIAGEGRSGD